MSRTFNSLLDPGCDLSRYESNDGKFTAIMTSIQLGLFKSMFTAEILSKALKDAGAEGDYDGRDVYEVLEDVRAKALDALHAVADDAEVAFMYSQYQREEDDA
jgi:hypothetical protein